ncbi:PMR5N domain-containing protein [Psidium guajava]|nr:PMR5N domain-containing protein [Psidium guajava]
MRSNAAMEKVLPVVDQIKMRPVLVLSGRSKHICNLLSQHFVDIGQLETVAIGAMDCNDATRHQMRKILIEALLILNTMVG